MRQEKKKSSRSNHTTHHAAARMIYLSLVNRTVMKTAFLFFMAVALAVALCGRPPAAVAQSSPSEVPQSAQEQGDGSRQVILEEFTRARPARILPKSPVSVSTSRRNPIPRVTVKAPRYNRKTPSMLSALNLPASLIAEVGLTLWRLRPAQATDNGARMLVMDNGRTSPWIPERIEADQLLDLGERVRISIESPKAGFLYVVDREQYADGTLGEPMLIFPTTRTLGGNNLIKPGVLIDIPGQDDSPPYFTLTSSNRKYIGEVLSIVVAGQPIEGLTIGRSPLSLPLIELQNWERLWRAQMERFELDGGAGSLWTAVEKAAALAPAARTLTQDEPSPQTIYRVAMRTASGFMVTVPLQRRR